MNYTRHLPICLLVLLGLYGCALGPRIDMSPRQSKPRLYFKSDMKPFSVGVIFGIDLRLTIGFGGTKISRFEILDDHDSVFWAVEKDSEKASVLEINYGHIPQRFRQTFPLGNEKPKPLVEGQLYRIRVEFVDGHTTNDIFSFRPGLLYLKKGAPTPTSTEPTK